MKQIKTLTNVEKYDICKKYMKDNDGNYHLTCRIAECPLSLKIDKVWYCFKDIPILEEKIREYWNKEINTDDIV